MCLKKSGNLYLKNKKVRDVTNNMLMWRSYVGLVQSGVTCMFLSNKTSNPQ
jgi:hypothetical protein